MQLQDAYSASPKRSQKEFFPPYPTPISLMLLVRPARLLTPLLDVSPRPVRPKLTFPHGDARPCSSPRQGGVAPWHILGAAGPANIGPLLLPAWRLLDAPRRRAARPPDAAKSARLLAPKATPLVLRPPSPVVLAIRL